MIVAYSQPGSAPSSVVLGARRPPAGRREAGGHARDAEPADHQFRRLGELHVEIARQPDQVLQRLAGRAAEPPGQHDPCLGEDRPVMRGPPQLFQGLRHPFSRSTRQVLPGRNRT